MDRGIYTIRHPENERVLDYKPGSKEKAEIKNKLNELKSQKIEIPLIIGGKEVRTGNTGECIIPHHHEHILGMYHVAGEKELQMAMEASLKAKKTWEQMPWEHRASVFLKMAELLSGSYRATLNAATMLTQSKTVHQAEVDAACELIDFLRFNVYFAQEIYSEQPNSTKAYWNRLDYRPLEGFVLAISPFNFTAIGGNLAAAPAILGNVVNWKPATTSVYSNYFFMRLLMEAGLPDGVINFVPSSGKDVSNVMLTNENLAGIHFTGSSEVFQDIWKTIGENIHRYKNYPRLVGETGGKDFVFVHNSADVEPLAAQLIRGAFEYQGQKCSAASRVYVPESLWEPLKAKLLKEVKELSVGDVMDFKNFMGAVINRQSFEKIKGYIEYTKNSKEAEIIHGGAMDDSKGYFVEPTIILTKDPRFKTMTEEIFGPVLTIYVYKDEEFQEALKLCNETSPYGLTGSIFAKDRDIITHAEKVLYYTAGNFYINDKPTGAIVGQQPFGGARLSGTNDKAGSKLNLLRWINPRTIKETFDTPRSYKYDYMLEE